MGHAEQSSSEDGAQVDSEACDVRAAESRAGHLAEHTADVVNRTDETSYWNWYVSVPTRLCVSCVDRLHLPFEHLGSPGRLMFSSGSGLVARRTQKDG